LRDAVDAAGLVGGGCVLLSGAPGVGKSALTRSFGFEITGRNCVFAYGRCREGASAPYAALGEALRAIVRASPTASGCHPADF
jgi:predicted ATPase